MKGFLGRRKEKTGGRGRIRVIFIFLCDLVWKIIFCSPECHLRFKGTQPCPCLTEARKWDNLSSLTLCQTPCTPLALVQGKLTGKRAIFPLTGQDLWFWLLHPHEHWGWGCFKNELWRQIFWKIFTALFYRIQPPTNAILEGQVKLWAFCLDTMVTWRTWMVSSDPLRVFLLCLRWWSQDQKVQALLHLNVQDADLKSQVPGMGGRSINLVAKCAVPRSPVPASVSFWEENEFLLWYSLGLNSATGSLMLSSLYMATYTGWPFRWLLWWLFCCIYLSCCF